MSKALAVFHGRFGRATVYQLNRRFNTHAHREGHLIFYVDGMPAVANVAVTSAITSTVRSIVAS